MMNLAVDISTVFDCDVLVDNITFDVATGYDRHVDAADWTNDAATHKYIFCSHLAVYDALNVDDHGTGADVAIDGSVDLQLTAGQKSTFDHHIGGDD